MSDLSKVRQSKTRRGESRARLTENERVEERERPGLSNRSQAPGSKEEYDWSVMSFIRTVF